MSTSKIKVKRGLRASLPSSTEQAEFLYTVDTKELFLGNGSGFSLTQIARKHNLDATISPTSANDASQYYTKGSLWINNTSKKWYICIDNSSGAAIWKLSSTAWSDITGTPTTLTGYGITDAEPTLTKGNLSEATSSVLTITGGTSSVMGSGTSIQVKQASGTQAGYLSSTDWTTFNGKQPLLGYVPENVANKGIAGGYASLDSNSKLVQNVDAGNITSGTINIARLPTGALERLVVVANQTARYALTTASVQNGDTVKQTDTGVMYFVVDDANLNNANGYQVYTAGSATTVPWSGVTSTPTTLSGYGITDATPSSHMGSGGTAHAVATTSTAGFESAADKTKLDGIYAGATKVEGSTINGNIKVNGSELVVYTHVKTNYTAVVAPTSSNDSLQGYSVGSEWVDTVTKNYYVCVSNSVGAAVWTLTGAVSAAQTPRSYVNGCRLSWLTASTLAVEVGAINISGTTYELASRVSVGWSNVATGTSKAANTWYYVYLKVVSGTLTPYISTSVPNADAFGTTLALPTDAQAKYNSSWGRFVGSFRTDASQNIIGFVVSGNIVTYQGLGYAFILSDGRATTKTAINCRSYVPYTSEVANVYVYDGSSTANKYVGDANNWTWMSTHLLGGIEIIITVMNDSIYYQASSSNGISLGIHGYLESI